jgi:hypothetical protein
LVLILAGKVVTCKNVIEKDPRFFLSSYLPPPPAPILSSACIGRRYLLHREKKNYERGKEDAFVAEGCGSVGEGGGGDSNKTTAKKRRLLLRLGMYLLFNEFVKNCLVAIYIFDTIY